MIVGEGEKQTSIDDKLFNSVSSSGWQILILLEVVETTGAIFERKTTMLNLTLKHINATLKETRATATAKSKHKITGPIA